MLAQQIELTQDERVEALEGRATSLEHFSPLNAVQGLRLAGILVDREAAVNRRTAYGSSGGRGIYVEA